MRKALVVVGLLVLIALPALAAEHAGCMKGDMSKVQHSVANIDNGVKITMTSSDPKVAAMLQEQGATCCKGGDCPMQAKGVTRTVEKVDGGIVITATASDAALVKQLQEHGAMMAKGSCCAGDKAKASCCHKDKGGEGAAKS